MAQKEMEELKRRNQKLESELKSCHELYQNLMEEKELESCDNRRAFMLKAQIFQLERQCMLLSQAQASRAAVLNETESQIIKLIRDFQQLLSGGSAGPHVNIGRSQLVAFIGMLQRLKNSIYRQSTLESPDNLRIPSLFSGSRYTKKSLPISCLDICSGSVEHVNLTQVARLELRLSELHGRLSSLHAVLRLSATQEGLKQKSKEAARLKTPEKQLLSPDYSYVAEVAQNCLAELETCRDELVSLSLLHPNAPWPAGNIAEQVGYQNVEKVLKALPSFQRKAELVSYVRKLCRAHAHTARLHDLELNAINLHIAYFKQTRLLQLQYVQSLFSGIINAYEHCEEDIIRTVRTPMLAILDAWYKLKGDQCSENMKSFLSLFKHYESDLKKLSALTLTKERVAEKTLGDSVLHDLTGRLDAALDVVEKKYKQELAEAQQNIEKQKLACDEMQTTCRK